MDKCLHVPKTMHVPACDDATRLALLTPPMCPVMQMCYSDQAFNDRPWRKKNKAYPSVSAAGC